MSGDSPQAAIYQGWYFRISEHLFADDLGEQLWEAYADERNYIAMALDAILTDNTNAWCDDIRTPAKEDCATALGAALADGLADMSKAQGSNDLKTWRWDRVHHTIFPHNVFDGVGALKPIFSRSIPNGGDAFTVDVAPINRSMPYHQSHVPSYREIIDLSDLNASHFMHTVGQSGQVVSGDYSNLIERWVKIEYLPMRYAKETIDEASVVRLVLEP
jgi:penicillin G amidase